MADIEFEVAKKRRQPLTFTLEGEDYEYTFTPPKAAVMMLPIMEKQDNDAMTGIALTRATFDWLGAGLSEEDNERIINRLKDPKDDLDSDDLGNLVQKISEKVGSRPTT